MKEKKQETIDQNKPTLPNLPEMPPGFEEQEDANFIKFEEVGDTLNGKLLSKEVSNRYGFKLYTILTATKDTLRFHGSQQLDPLLSTAQEGDDIFVSFIDTIETQGGNPMKIFKVGIKKGKHN